MLFTEQYIVSIFEIKLSKTPTHLNVISKHESDIKNLSKLSVNLMGSLSALQKELRAVNKVNRVSYVLMQLDIAHSDTIVSGRLSHRLVDPDHLEKAVNSVKQKLPGSLQITFGRDESLL